MRHMVLGIAIAGTLAALAGCATSGKRGVAQNAPRPPSAQAFDRVSAAKVREDALVVVHEFSKAEDARLRANAVEAAGVVPQRGKELIRAGLADRNAAVRTVAATMVGKRRIGELADACRPLLSDSSSFVRASAIYALAQCGQEVDRSPLASVLLEDKSIRARCHAAFLLGEMGDPSARLMLRSAARSKPAMASTSEWNLFQLQIAEALVKLGDTEQLSTLRAALYPSRPEELEGTALAVQIIGQIGDRESIDQLIYLSAQKDQAGNKMPAEVRLGVAASLARLGLPQGDFLADEFVGDPAAPIRAQSAYVYGETGTPENLGVLAKMLEDSEPGVRVSAAAAILRMSERQAAAQVGQE